MAVVDLTDDVECELETEVAVVVGGCTELVSGS